MSRTSIAYDAVNRDVEWKTKELVARSHSDHSSSGSSSDSADQERSHADSGVENESTSLSPKVSDVSGAELSAESSSTLDECLKTRIQGSRTRPSVARLNSEHPSTWSRFESRVGVGNMMATIPAERTMDLAFRSLSYSASVGRKGDTKKILHGVYGRFRPGTLSAIMGPSGAGKTSLLNVLAGYRSGNVQGEILVNGDPRDPRKFRKQSSYIMQDDFVFGNLTVTETLLFAAELKCGSGTHQERKLLVTDIIETLGMTTCASTLARSLSGGERKRLCIAVELINNPPIMFFDEPTSGLDSQTCFQFISLLSALAAAGRTVICTIHQPSMRLLEMFQHLVVLAHGRCIYRGSVPNMVPYLASKGLVCPPYHNPADFVMEFLLTETSGPIVKTLVEGMNNGKCEDYDEPSGLAVGKLKREDSDESSIDVPQTKSDGDLLESRVWIKEGDSCIKEPLTDGGNDYEAVPASYAAQVGILMRRGFLLIVRDRILLVARAASHLVVGITMGMMFFGIGNDADRAWNIAASVYFNMILLIFAAMMATILTFPLELSVIIREHMNSWYSLKMYFIAQTLLDLPFQVFFATIYHTVIYFMSGHPLEYDRFFLLLAVSIFASVTGQNMGLLVGSAVHIQVGVFLGPVITVPMMVFSGFFISITKMPAYLRWISYITYIRYSYEASFAVIFGMNREDLDCNRPYCMFKNPEIFLETLDLENPSYWPNLLILIAFAAVFRFLSYIAVRRRVVCDR